MRLSWLVLAVAATAQAVADELKIDQSFIRTLGHSQKNDALVSSMVDLARRFGLRSVAEGVETADTLLRVQACGCEIVQGFYYSRPLPADEFSKWAVAWAEKLRRYKQSA